MFITELQNKFAKRPLSAPSDDRVCPLDFRCCYHVVDSAKTDVTKVKRIALAVNALAKGLGYAQMLRSLQKNPKELG